MVVVATGWERLNFASQNIRKKQGMFVNCGGCLDNKCCQDSTFYKVSCLVAGDFFFSRQEKQKRMRRGTNRRCCVGTDTPPENERLEPENHGFFKRNLLFQRFILRWTRLVFPGVQVGRRIQWSVERSICFFLAVIFESRFCCKGICVPYKGRYAPFI